MNICVLGLGYVGAVSCGCLAELGHNVIGVDIAEQKVDRINRGESPIIEEGLAEILRKAADEGRLSATTDTEEAIKKSEVALVCVGTPSTPTGGVNSIYLERVCEQIGEAVKKHNIPFITVLNRSTSLPHVHRRLIEILEKTSGRKMGSGIGYCCHPEFLREGAAVYDFYNPPKIVFGATDKHSEALCKKLYPNIDAETFFVTPDIAAMVKYADNCFHAVKVTFGNEMGMLCKQFGIDGHAVMDIFCADHKLNISPKYLKPGFAFGGSCLPKDLRAVLDASREYAAPLPMLAGTMDSNKHQVEAVFKRVTNNSKQPRPRLGVIGLAFKEGTDDVRESPMVTLVERATGKGLPVRIYDQHLAVQSLVGANLSFALESIPHLAELLSDDLAAVIHDSDVIVVAHRLSPEKWSMIKWRDDQRIIDLANVSSLHKKPNYDGLYW